MLAQSVRLQPDEMLSSWFTVMMDINRLDGQEFVGRMTGKTGRISIKEGSYPAGIEFLYSGICRYGNTEAGIIDLVRYNTILFMELPFMKTGKQAQVLEVILRGIGKRVLLKRILKKKKDKVSRICPACAEEDKKNCGRAYIHVPHQVPGVSACYRHGCKLISEDMYRIHSEPEKAEEVEIRIASFFYDLYNDPVRIDDRIRSLAVNDVMEKEGDSFKSFTDRNKHVIPKSDAANGWYALSEDTKHRFLASFFGYRVDKFRKATEIFANTEEEADALKEITESYDLLSPYGTVMCLHCRQCGTSFYTHPEMIHLGAGCPVCDSILPEKSIVERYVRRHYDGDYEMTESGTGTRIVHRSCRTEVKAPLAKFIFEYGECPTCAGKSRIGEVRYNGDGQKMTIIEYNKFDDVAVEFEDGTVVSHRTYNGFLHGRIENPNNNFRTRRVGLVNRSVNGQLMTIIDYRGAREVDIAFEDGTVVTGQSFENFLSGKILLPSEMAGRKILRPVIKATGIYKLDERIGETSVANNGQRMTIIRYRSAKDVDVVFEDGTEVCGIAYSKFQEGRVRNPKTCNKSQAEKKSGKKKKHRIKPDDHIGERVIDANGQVMELIRYRCYKDIDVKYEDGEVVTGQRYDSFLKGQILNSNTIIQKQRNEREGETRVNRKGMEMKIIRYGSSKDIDVEFEDGIVVKNKSYDHFLRGKIKHPDCDRRNLEEKWLGKSTVARNGLKMEVIACRKYDDVDIRFEDGTIVEHVSLKHLKEGSIRHPNLNHPHFKDFRVGETLMANNGQLMTIIAYRGANDIDVRFEDGTVVENRDYGKFKEGKIRHPGLPSKRIEPATLTDHTGETGTASDGSRIKIIVFRGYEDIDVEFEDGTVSEHRQYMQFKRGEIRNPSSPHGLSKRQSRIGETRVMKCGETATIIAYRNNKDIDVRFADGVVREHMCYSNFVKGDISNKKHGI